MCRYMYTYVHVQLYMYVCAHIHTYICGHIQSRVQLHFKLRLHLHTGLHGNHTRTISSRSLVSALQLQPTPVLLVHRTEKQDRVGLNVQHCPVLPRETLGEGSIRPGRLSTDFSCDSFVGWGTAVLGPTMTVRQRLKMGESNLDSQYSVFAVLRAPRKSKRAE